MPRPVKRFIQKWIISHRARKQATVEEATRSLFPQINVAQWLARAHVGRKTSDDAHQKMHHTLTRETQRFATTRAFRAAGIFGNETRNELLPFIREKNWNALKEKIGERRTNRMRQIIGEATRAAEGAIHDAYTQGEVAHQEERLQRPVHGIHLLASARKIGKKAA